LLEDFPGEIFMGWLSPGESQRIDITTYLPGEETENEFQSASITVKFLFRTWCESDDDDEWARLTVKKFQDVEQTGVFNADDGDEWLEGWPLLINDQEYETPISGLRVRPGTYEITELGRDGWEPTTETTVSVNLSDGDQETVIFGNYREERDDDSSRLIVRTFHDLNGDGTRNPGEPQLMDWNVYINGEPYQTPVSVGLDPGVYEISQEWDEEQWVPTTPDSITVELGEDDTELVVFGNRRFEDFAIPPPPPEAPPTGQFPPVVFYVTGFMLIFGGLVVAQRVKGGT
jgi:hypothetical protein